MTIMRATSRRPLAFVLATLCSVVLVQGLEAADLTLTAADRSGPAVSAAGTGLLAVFRQLNVPPITQLPDGGTAPVPPILQTPVRRWAATVNLVNFPEGADENGETALVRFARTGSTGSPPLGVDTVAVADLIDGDGFLGSPGPFTVVVSGLINIQAPGEYTFSLGHQDGARLYLGNRLLINDNFTGPFIETSKTVQFASAGLYPLQIDLFNNNADAALALSFAPPHGDRQVVPTRLLFPAGTRFDGLSETREATPFQCTIARTRIDITATMQSTRSVARITILPNVGQRNFDGLFRGTYGTGGAMTFVVDAGRAEVDRVTVPFTGSYAGTVNAAGPTPSIAYDTLLSGPSFSFRRRPNGPRDVTTGPWRIESVEDVPDVLSFTWHYWGGASQVPRPGSTGSVTMVFEQRLTLPGANCSVTGLTTYEIAFTVAPLLDIMPDSSRNCVNPNSGGNLVAAILGTPGFVTTQIDASTVVIDSAPATTGGVAPVRAFFDDVNRDGQTDLVLQFRIPDLQKAGLLGDGKELVVTAVQRSPTSAVTIAASDRIYLAGGANCR